MTLVLVWSLVLAHFSYSVGKNGEWVDHLSITIHSSKEACEAAKEGRFADAAACLGPFEKQDDDRPVAP